MSFWTKLGTGFKAIGHFIADFTVELPKIVSAGNAAIAQVPTLVTDVGALLNAVNKLVTMAVTDAKPIIASLVSLGTAIFGAVASGLTNIADDENVVVQTQGLIAAIKADYPAFASLTSALDGVVTAYDNTAAGIKAAVQAVEASVEGSAAQPAA